MSKRTYLDITPTELLGRQHITWGLALFLLPSLLTSCHTASNLCLTRWDGSVSPLISLWALFPWMLPIALVMAGGLGMVIIGGVLLDKGRRLQSVDLLRAAAFRTSVGSLLATLVIGAFGYFALDQISPGFLYARSAGVKNAWLILQSVPPVIYLIASVLTLGTIRAFPMPFPSHA
jgi:hypothetical protein